LVWPPAPWLSSIAFAVLLLAAVAQPGDRASAENSGFREPKADLGDPAKGTNFVLGSLLLAGKSPTDLESRWRKPG
jgi:hypothetical protein